MARPQKCRCICSFPDTTCFEPTGGETEESVTLGYDEYETIRLLDYEKFSQEQCAQRMNVSPVSYTHLDVYKRQVFMCPNVRPMLWSPKGFAKI